MLSLEKINFANANSDIRNDRENLLSTTNSEL